MDFNCGQIVGKWTILREAERPRHGRKHYVCVCTCGTEKTLDSGNLSRGATKQCKKCSLTTHGMSSTSIYKIWTGLHSRCYNSRRSEFRNYGGRGIQVCERWSGPRGFIYFLADMGIRPSFSHSVERKDVDSNYEPSNCVWATRAEQDENKRKAGALTFFSDEEIEAEYFRRKDK